MTLARKRPYLVVLIVLLAAFMAVAVTACGGDDDEGSTTTPTGNGIATPTGTGGETPSTNGGDEETFTLLMNESRGNVFVLEGQYNPTLKVEKGQKVTVNLDNDGSAIHNMRFSGNDNKYNTKDDAVSKPDIVAPGQKAVMTFTAPSKPGEYVYQCDFHPTDMRGEFEVVG